MHKYEVVECLQEVKRVFEEFEYNDTSIEYWYDATKLYTKGEFLKAFKTYVQTEDRKPRIANLRQKLEAICGKRAPTEQPSELTPANPRLELIMDVLGPETVTEELKRLVGDPKTVSWFDLVSQRDWVPRYREKFEELYQQALYFSKVPPVQQGVA